MTYVNKCFLSPIVTLSSYLKHERNNNGNSKQRLFNPR